MIKVRADSNSVRILPCVEMILLSLNLSDELVAMMNTSEVGELEKLVSEMVGFGNVSSLNLHPRVSHHS